MDEQNKEQNALAVKEPTQNPNAVTMWNDAKLYNQSLAMAQTLSKSEIIPQSYKGKPADCLIAIDIANLLGLSPAIVMQNSQCVRGNFTWKGSACKSMIDGCER